MLICESLNGIFPRSTSDFHKTFVCNGTLCNRTSYAFAVTWSLTCRVRIWNPPIARLVCKNDDHKRHHTRAWSLAALALARGHAFCFYFAFGTGSVTPFGRIIIASTFHFQRECDVHPFISSTGKKKLPRKPPREFLSPLALSHFSTHLSLCAFSYTQPLILLLHTRRKKSYQQPEIWGQIAIQLYIIVVIKIINQYELGKDSNHSLDNYRKMATQKRPTEKLSRPKFELGISRSDSLTLWFTS